MVTLSISPYLGWDPERRELVGCRGKRYSPAAVSVLLVAVEQAGFIVAQRIDKNGIPSIGVERRDK